MSMKVAEVILYVHDMAQMVTFYHEQLGLPLKYNHKIHDYSNTHWVEFDTGDCTLCLHVVEQDKPIHNHTTIVFEERRLVMRREDLLAKGVPLDEIRSPAEGIIVCDGKDPEGNRFTLEARLKPVE